MRKIRVNNNGIFSLLLRTFVFLFIASLSYSASVPAQNLQNDIVYYRKVAREKNLSPNDRYYILLTIERKYENQGIDMSPIEAEMANLNNESPKNDSSGRVEKILITETARSSRIIISAPGVRRFNYFVLKDPSPAEPSKIVLDLAGARDALSERSRDIRTKTGIFSRVTSEQFEGKPNYTVRITASMREQAAYKILSEGNGRFVIQAEKKIPPDNPVIEDSTEQPAAQEQPPVLAPAVEPTAPGVASRKKTAKDNYRIEVGDVLGISVFPAEELSREAIVQADGKISFPLVGSLKAKGQTPKELEELMSQNLGKYVSSPQVTIVIKQFNRRQIFITGEVRSVGAYNYKDNLRLLEFISSLGGFTSGANRKEIKIYRGSGGKRQIHTVSVEDVILSGDFSKDFVLEPGDIIEVPQGRSRVAILGDIRNPGYYDYRADLHLLELISLAGGFSDTAHISKISILRQDGEKDPSVFKVNLKKILSGDERDVTVKPGDTVYLPKKSIATANWFVNNILPWLSLISLVIIIRAGI